MTIFKWLWAIVYKHGWWKKNPRAWKKIARNKGKFSQAIPFDKLPNKYKKRGTPIHAVRCKVCGEVWYTSCQLPLCKKLGCWRVFYKRR